MMNPAPQTPHVVSPENRELLADPTLVRQGVDARMFYREIAGDGLDDGLAWMVESRNRKCLHSATYKLASFFVERLMNLLTALDAAGFPRFKLRAYTECTLSASNTRRRNYRTRRSGCQSRHAAPLRPSVRCHAAPLHSCKYRSSGTRAKSVV